MTDQQTVEEIKAAMPDGVVLANPLQPVQHWESSEERSAAIKEAGLVESEKIPCPTGPVEKRRGLKTLFTRDEMIPLKGVWFQAVEVEEEKLVLVPRHFTKKFAKQNK